MGACRHGELSSSFALLFLDWRYRLDKAWYLRYEFPQNYLQVESLDERPDRLMIPQQQALKLLFHVSVDDSSDKSMGEKRPSATLRQGRRGRMCFVFGHRR